MLIFVLPFFLIFSAIGIGAGSESIGAGAALIGGGIIGMIFGIIVYGVIIFVVTLIATSLLNFVLKKTGGLDIDFEKVGFDFEAQSNQGRIEQ
ncbi:hypothetical protein [uncultured Winogradskyella sp.]|uniref:hypothetical protein n=1 Tax=uncultured Winogradskyella sp. TaxID=395353 RepID=UPI002622D257|nr:hypothetical protein [uncultured Winogradskyella sp.]